MSFFAPDPDDFAARYMLELDGVVVAMFAGAEGLKSEREILQVHEGGRQGLVQRLGPFARGWLALTEGEADDHALIGWVQDSVNADYMASSRRTGCILYVDGNGQERRRWKFRRAHVVEWVGPAEIPAPGFPYEVEDLVIAHEGLEEIAS